MSVKVVDIYPPLVTSTSVNNIIVNYKENNEPVMVIQTTLFTCDYNIEGLRAKRAYIGFWSIFIFCRIELIFDRLTCFDMKCIVLLLSWSICANQLLLLH